MNTSHMWMVVSAAVSAAAPTARAHDRETLIANERAWGQAFITGDVGVIERLLAKDFQGFETNGSAYKKTDTIAFAKALPHGTADRVDNFNIRFFGNVAVVQAHEWVNGPPPQRLTKERVFTDVWVKRRTNWQIVAAQDTLRSGR